MNYFEKIVEIVKKATVEEAYMVLRFAENVEAGDRERRKDEADT